MSRRSRSKELESYVEKAFIRECRARGLWQRKFESEAGDPDRLIVHGGRAYFVELKREGEVLRELQKWARDKLLRMADAEVYVLTTPQEVEAFFKEKFDE